MNEHTRATALLEILRQGLQHSGEQQSKLSLGDRTTYIGMSDIGRYMECPRAALANKLKPQPPILERLLALQRGHWFEEGIARSLAILGLHILPQLEIRYEYRKTPVRAHLDFTLVWQIPRPAVRILEVKTMEQLPDQPYAAHEVQIRGQVGMLHRLWNKPVFTLRNVDGTIAHENRTFPQLCKERFGLILPDAPQNVSLEGWLLCLSMREAQAFGPYCFDSCVLQDILKHAQSFWGEMASLQKGRSGWSSLSYAQGFYPLCPSCRHSMDCPKFPQGRHLPQWEPALEKLAALKEQRTALDAEIKEIEAVLRMVHRQSGTHDWVDTGKYRFRASATVGRNTLNREALRKELTDIFRLEALGDMDVDALLARCERTGAPSERLSISSIN